MGSNSSVQRASAPSTDQEISSDQLQRFLTKLMEIQKRYAYEFRNVKADRQGEVIELINKFVAKELDEQ